MNKKAVLIERYNNVFAQGAITYSKRSDRYIGNAPGFVTEMPLDTCDTFLNEDKLKFKDFAGGLGAINYTAANITSIPMVKEIEFAEKLKERIPILEKIKILKTGSEACLAAVRIARAYNNKYLILGSGYHGWGEIFAQSLKENGGVVDKSYQCFVSNLALLNHLTNLSYEEVNEVYDKSVSAVIIEPVTLDIDVEDVLKRIREECDRLDIVLIYDEVITGFRVPEYCIANYYVPTPDILCLGKTIADGYPISIVGGLEKIMDNPDYFVSSTFAGENVSITNALTVMEFITKKRLDNLWRNGKMFMDSFNDLSQDIRLYGYNTRMAWTGDYGKIFMFHQEMAKKGYILGRSFFYNFYVERSIEEFFVATIKVIQKIEKGEIALEHSKPVLFSGDASSNVSNIR